MRLIQPTNLRSSDRGDCDGPMKTFGTNTTSVFLTDAIASWGTMVTPVMSFRGDCSTATSRGSNNPFSLPILPLSQSSPAAQSVSNTP
jgi:hypothetical protein